MKIIKAEFIQGVGKYSLRFGYPRYERLMFDNPKVTVKKERVTIEGMAKIFKGKKSKTLLREELVKITKDINKVDLTQVPNSIDFIIREE